MADKRRECMKYFDHLRKLLLQEPRGYPCQNANIIFPSKIPDCLFGYVILEQNKIYPLMSGCSVHFIFFFYPYHTGHNTICVVTALIQSGMIALPITGILFSLENNLACLRSSTNAGVQSRSACWSHSHQSFV
jgi:proline racemase